MFVFGLPRKIMSAEALGIMVGPVIQQTTSVNSNVTGLNTENSK